MSRLRQRSEQCGPKPRSARHQQNLEQERSASSRAAPEEGWHCQYLDGAQWNWFGLPGSGMVRKLISLKPPSYGNLLPQPQEANTTSLWLYYHSNCYRFSWFCSFIVSSFLNSFSDIKKIIIFPSFQLDYTVHHCKHNVFGSFSGC